MVNHKRMLGFISSLCLLKPLIFSPVFAAQNTAIELLQPVRSAAAKVAKSGGVGAMQITVNTDQIHTLQKGDTLNLSLPNMRQYALVYDRSEVHDSQRASWVGHLKDLGDNYRVVITSDQQGSVGNISTPEGNFVLRTEQGNTWLYDLKALGAKPFEPTKEDIRIPPKTSTLPAQQTSSHLLQNLPLQTPPDTLVTVDVMVAYTTNLLNALGSVNAVITKINQLVTLTNQAYLDSEVGIQLRLVHTEQVDYNDAVDQSASLDAITNHTGVFSNIGTLRDAKGADLVVLLHPFSAANNSCGVAWLGGYNGTPMAWYAESGYSVVATGNLANGAYCGEHTFAHELGHNMGSAHDRRTMGSNTTTGAYPYSFGYGIDNGFVSIMGYGSFYTNAQTVYKFSNPHLTSCFGVACGVGSQLSNAADNALSLNNTRQAVANFRPAANLGTQLIPTPNANAATHLTSGGFVANWNSAVDATGYRLSISSDNTFSHYNDGGVDNVDVGNVTAFQIMGLKANTTYYYKVRAYSATGGLSADSNIVSATTATALATPTLIAPTGTIASKTPVFTWSRVPDATHYAITINDGSGADRLFTYSATRSGCALSGNCTITPATQLTSGITYQGVVKASNNTHNSAWSAPISFTVSGVDDAFPAKGLLPTGWTTPANSQPWTVATDSTQAGTYALKSGAIGDSATSAITVSANFRDGVVRFSRRVSSEMFFDHLRFYIDGILQPNAEWSGELAWAAVAYPVTAGVHELKWRYEKDDTGKDGSDAAWIDAVSLPLAFADNTATGNSFYNNVLALADAGITSGCGNGNFCIGDTVTRGQMAVFIIRALEGESSANCAATDTLFTDAPISNSFCKYVKALKARNITAGVSATEYGIDQPVTRWQMAAFIVRAVDGVNNIPPACSSSSFADVAVSHPFCGYIKRLAELNITSGCKAADPANGVLADYCPDATVTRGQMAAFISRAFLGMP